MSNQLLWQPKPDDIHASNLTAFSRVIESAEGVNFGNNYKTLHAWSLNNPEQFWSRVWDFTGIIGDKGERILVDGDKMPGAQWFPDAKLNFAENLLRDRPDENIAIVFQGEEQVLRRISFGELKRQVANMAAYFREHGVRQRDRIAAYIPNMPEAIVGMLAAASIGAIWSSCSQDFGVPTVLERFSQIEPRVLIAADGYFHKGQKHDRLANVKDLLGKLPSVENLLVIPYINDEPDLGSLPRSRLWRDALRWHENASLKFEPLPFNHPLYIMYTSGTTGKPKSIVHGAGGTLIQHLKEHQLHCDIRSNDKVMYQTTTGWMMWNWLVSALASEATVMLYDGDAMRRRGNIIFDFVADEEASFYGTSAAFLGTADKIELRPSDNQDFSNLRTITSTGSPLAPSSFDFVYDAVKKDVHLSSISGGTDIISCFVLGNPWSSVYRGEIEGPGLGMDVQVWNNEGQEVFGQLGELVCARPFPSMPIGFWDDRDGNKYRDAYFKRFPGVWRHGDFMQTTSNGGFIINSRSDSVINVQGVRIGTAEIYNIVKGAKEVDDALVVQQGVGDGERAILFIQLGKGAVLNDDLERCLRKKLSTEGSPRHVPALIVQAPELPYTISGKLMESTIRDIINDNPVVNEGAMRNPDSLKFFRGWHLSNREEPQRSRDSKAVFFHRQSLKNLLIKVVCR